MHAMKYRSAFKIKTGNSGTCYNTGEPRGHSAKWNKPVTKGQTLYESTYTRYLE